MMPKAYERLLRSLEESANIGDSIRSNPTFEALSSFVKSALNLVKKVTVTLKIPELVNTLIHFTRSIPLIGRLIPNSRDEETKVREMLAVTNTGDILTTIANLNQHIFSTIWKVLPVSTEFKDSIILPIFNYNDRMAFIRTLYSIMIDSDVSPKHAKAFIIVLATKIPIYNILFVFKSFWGAKKSNPTIDDKIHPFTSGDPVNDIETGLNETERILQKKIQTFIQAHKRANGEVQKNYFATRMIIKEAIIGIVVPFLLPMFNFFRISFGIGNEEGSFFGWLDEMIKLILMIYYYYFLITSMILSSLAIEKEATN